MRNGGPPSGRAERAVRTGAAPAAVERVGLLAAVALAALGLTACGEKITTVNPSFTAPEGAASTQSGLAVWREIPNHLYIYRRGNPDASPPIPHVLVDSVTMVTTLPGQLHGVIRDSTTSNSYQVYRREPNNGYRVLYDFNAVPARRWFDRGWEIYHFTDADTAVPTHTYLGRGVIGGGATLASPLTNEASDLVRAVQNITYKGLTGFNIVGDPTPLDSLFTMKWLKVTNAVAYYIHVYQWSFNLIQFEEQIASGMPAPLFIGKSRDILVAYMPAPNPSPNEVSFTMPPPDGRPAAARILTCRQTRYGQEYLVRISAVDANGQLIAYTYGSYSQELNGVIPGGISLPTTEFAVYPLGAVKVVPSRPQTPAPNRAGRVAAQHP
jgi:hypothetical protein